MPLDTYDNLKISIASWLDRSDLVSQIPDFITLFEAKANRLLKENKQTNEATITPINGEITVPSDYLGWEEVILNGISPRNLKERSLTFLLSSFPEGIQGRPEDFAVKGDKILIRPVSGDDIKLIYTRKIPSLSATNQTNWLLDNHPDAYLSGSIAVAYTFIGNASASALYDRIREIVLGEINMMKIKYTGTRSRTASGPTP